MCCALNIESAQPVFILIFECALYLTKIHYNAVLLYGFKNARHERFRFKKNIIIIYSITLKQASGME